MEAAYDRLRQEDAARADSRHKAAKYSMCYGISPSCSMSVDVSYPAWTNVGKHVAVSTALDICEDGTHLLLPGNEWT